MKVTPSWCARAAPHYGLVLLDLDNFKLSNDRFGHEAGDRVPGRFKAMKLA